MLNDMLCISCLQRLIQFSYEGFWFYFFLALHYGMFNNSKQLFHVTVGISCFFCGLFVVTMSVSCDMSFIYFCVGNVIPIKEVRFYPNNKSWVSKEIKHIIHLKKMAFIEGDKKRTNELRKELKIKTRLA